MEDDPHQSSTREYLIYSCIELIIDRTVVLLCVNFGAYLIIPYCTSSTRYGCKLRVLCACYELLLLAAIYSRK